MSFRYVADIAQQLIQHGRSPDTYALCVSWLSYPQQRIVTAPLAHISAAVADARLEAPALLVVGDVVHFWKQLHEGSMEPGVSETTGIGTFYGIGLGPGDPEL